MGPVKRYHDDDLIKAVSDNLDQSQYRAYVEQVIVDLLRKEKTYLWGGAVRDSIVKAFYGRNGAVNDFDILVDDSEAKIDFERLLRGFDNVSYSRLGSPKWRPKEGLEIDIVPFSNATRLRNGERLPISLDTALQSCDFTTSAIAYSPKDKTIHSCNALESIRRQEIDLNYPLGDEPHILMSKAVLHADKLGFQRGPVVNDLIRKKYSPKLDEPIRRWLEYKGMAGKAGRVIEELRKIKVQHQDF